MNYQNYLLITLQSVLMLPVVHHAVFGAYTCIAENIHGKLEKVRHIYRYLPISTDIYLCLLIISPAGGDADGGSQARDPAHQPCQDLP